MNSLTLTLFLVPFGWKPWLLRLRDFQAGKTHGYSLVWFWFHLSVHVEDYRTTQHVGCPTFGQFLIGP